MKLVIVDSPTKGKTVLDMVKSGLPLGTIPEIHGPIFPKTTLGMYTMLRHINESVVIDTEDAPTDIKEVA